MERQARRALRAWAVPRRAGLGRGVHLAVVVRARRATMRASRDYRRGAQGSRAIQQDAADHSCRPRRCGAALPR